MKSIIAVFFCLITLQAVSQQGNTSRNGLSFSQEIEASTDETIKSHGTNGKITVDFNVNGKGYLFDIYDLSGNLLQRESLIKNITILSFTKKGTFHFQIVDPFTLEVQHQGKFTA